jgi:hypothetical protein
MVEPGTGGMSVSPNDPMNLPSFRRPVEFGGTGKDPVWCMGSCDLPSGLQYRADPLNTGGHGFIEPAYPMPFEDYQNLLWETQASWGPA